MVIRLETDFNGHALRKDYASQDRMVMEMNCFHGIYMRKSKTEQKLTCHGFKYRI